MTVKNENLLRRLRDRYSFVECSTYTTANDNKTDNNNNNNDINILNWPRAPFPRREETPSNLDCPSCRQLLLELQCYEKEKAEDLSAIDLLTVTLAWERAHGTRRGRQGQQQQQHEEEEQQQQQQRGFSNKPSRENIITVTPSSSGKAENKFYQSMKRNNGSNEFGESSDILADVTPSKLREAYLSLREKQSIAEEEWFQQRCRYEREISELKKQLTQVERSLNSKNELCELLQRECRVKNR